MHDIPASHDPATTPIRRIVIAGGGTAGWMVAAGLSRTLGAQLDIVLVESDEIPTVGVGEATIPTLVTFHRALGIDERAFMAATQATFKLGIRFVDWRARGQEYVHSFGTTGKDHWSAGFQHFWRAGRTRGLAGDYGDYCLELRAALEDRFAHLPDNGLNYAFHMDAGLYARFLRGFSESHGARRIEGRIAEVQADREAGRIEALVLASGERIEGDLFIDCTGFRGLLIEQALGVGYEDWSHWLLCDSAIAVQTTSVGPAVPYTRSTAREAGWQWRIPLQHRVGNGIVFSSRHTDDAQARDTLLAALEGERLTDPRTIRFRPGQRERSWHGNCVAIGLSSGFLEPLESTSIHLIQRGIVRLLQLFPTGGIRKTDVDEYNRQSREETEQIRDFVILHYKVTDRDDTPFWRACRTMDVPEALRHRIALFGDSGRVFRDGFELFAENSWVQVMLGQGLTPRSHHPVADLMSDEELSQFLGKVQERVARTLQQLPAHAQYVRNYCPAAAD
ncbi:MULTISPECIES: tryptophan halogenase family protein [Luteimonas]|uniref:tryptophan halogenase family protein n=1 Tax=Luteimonas TaxID=83614 RepID=UPI000C7A8C1F|nr:MULTISPECIES: tryptophan halogenase family protein [Luteimonas]